jgi:hypothetical protein
MLALGACCSVVFDLRNRGALFEKYNRCIKRDFIARYEKCAIVIGLGCPKVLVFSFP